MYDITSQLIKGRAMSLIKKDVCKTMRSETAVGYYIDDVFPKDIVQYIDNHAQSCFTCAYTVYKYIEAQVRFDSFMFRYTDRDYSLTAFEKKDPELHKRMMDYLKKHPETHKRIMDDFKKHQQDNPSENA